MKKSKGEEKCACNYCHGELVAFGHPQYHKITAMICTKPECAAYGLLQVSEEQAAKIANSEL